MLSPHHRNRLIPIIIAIPNIVQSIDTTSIATALPTMARDLGVHPLSLNLAITTFLLALAVFLPLSSWLADRYGPRNVFCAAILMFAAGSAACGLANSLPELVV